MLKLHNIYKNYKIGKEEIPILKDINLTIEQGEFISIVGPSGCGKTTLLNIIAGMDKSSEGSIEFAGQKMDSYRDREWSAWRKSHIGYVFQQFNLIEFMTARQNIEVAIQLTEANRKNCKKRAQNLLEQVGLKGRDNHRPAQLSGGQKQRVAIARALANQPNIILADEPTGAMDSQSAAEIMKLLKKINRAEGVTIIMVTHDEKLAAEADRKISMIDGKIVADIATMPYKRVEGVKEKREKKKGAPLISLSVVSRNLRTKKKRTFLTSLATAIGIAGVLVAFGIGNGAKDKILKEVGSIVNYRVVEVGENDVKMDEEVKEKILENENVLNIYPNFRIEGACKYGDMICAGMVYVMGPQEQPIPFWEDNLLYGSFPTGDNVNEVIITSTMAQTLVGEGEDIQDIIGKEVDMVFAASSQNTIPVQVKRTITITGIAGKAFLGMVERINLPYLTAEGIAKESLQQENYITSIYCVTIKSDKAAVEVKDMLCDMGFEASIDEEAIGSIGTIINMVVAVIMIIAGISLIVAGIMIALVTYIGVVERTREIGTLRAVGFSAKNISRIFLTEGACIGLFSGLIGVVLANAIGKLVNLIMGNIYPEVASSLYLVELKHIAFCMLFSISIGVLCSLSPARKAAKMEPVTALGYAQ